MNDVLSNKIFEIERAIKARNQKKNDISLLNGDMGIAIFYAALYRVTKEQKYLNTCHELVDSSIDKVARMELNPSFVTGFTGIGWSLQYLMNNNYLESTDLLQDLDAYIYDASINKLRGKYYDFLHGGTGAAVYAMERENDEAVVFLETYLKYIDEIKEENKYGYAWEDYTFPKGKDHLHARAYTLGLSHGVPSIIMVLLRIHKLGINNELTKDLITGGLNWIKANKIENVNSISEYPNCVYDSVGTIDGPSLMRWCYGDMGIALMYWDSGNILNEGDWIQDGEDLMRRNLKRTDLIEQDFYDAGVCHGTAGVAHIFSKYHERTRNTEFKEKADFWMTQSLQAAKHEKGPAGYKFHNAAENNGVYYNRWRKMYGLLNGIAGVGLVFLSHLEPALNWDKALLIDHISS
ncbi:MAG: lanthionine synthetase C family protein [Cytophagales bacterium]|nr:lanthionine synthetase C family protein [Cytophagales bacterium]